MHRREALKTLTGIFGMTVTLPVWGNAWHLEKLPEPSLLASTQKQILSDLVGTIIPKTNTPGATELNVQRFVELMVQDCFDDNVKKQLSSGLDQLDQEARKQVAGGFSKLNAGQKLALVKDWSGRKDSEQQSFVNSVKNLTIQGYQTSEYYMTNVSRYELVPARFHGCVDLKS